MEEFKERQRAMWAAGDFGTLAEYIKDVGEHVVARTDVEAGMRVLDVACGTGNAALPAARVGAQVTGLDLVPELLEGGVRRPPRRAWTSTGWKAMPRSCRSRMGASTASSPRSGTCSRHVIERRRTRWCAFATTVR